MENKKNTNLLIGVGVVLIIVAVVWSMRSSTKSPADQANDVEIVIPTEDLTEGSVNANPVAPLTYAQALAKYKDARIQLGENCQASPNNVTYKNNTSIMIDNRAPVSRTVKVGSAYNVKAWGFKIIKLSSATLPATWYVDCDKSQNVATILIQK